MKVTVEKKDSGSIHLVGVRHAFPSLFSKTAFENEEPAFQDYILIPKTAEDVVKFLKNEMALAGQKTWKDKATEYIQQAAAAAKICLKDGDLKKWDGFPGNWYIKARNTTQPTLLGKAKQKFNGPDGLGDDGTLYAGCYVVAAISFFAWGPGKFQVGISANLKGIQFYADGDAFTGGGTASVDEFGGDVPTFSGAPGADLF